MPELQLAGLSRVPGGNLIILAEVGVGGGEGRTKENSTNRNLYNALYLKCLAFDEKLLA